MHIGRLVLRERSDDALIKKHGSDFYTATKRRQVPGYGSNCEAFQYILLSTSSLEMNRWMGLRITSDSYCFCTHSVGLSVYTVLSRRRPAGRPCRKLIFCNKDLLKKGLCIRPWKKDIAINAQRGRTKA